MKEKKSNKRRKLMLSSLAMLGVSTISLSVATYAWFSMGNTADVSGMEFTAQAASGIQISADASNWKSSLTFGGETGDFASQDSKVVPSKLRPVSTTATVTNDGTLTFYEVNKDQTAIQAVTDLSTPTDANTAGAFYKFDIYVRNQSTEAQQFNLVVSGEDEAKSAVTAKPTTSESTQADDTTTDGAQNAVRVAFINQGASDTSKDATAKAQGGTAKIWEPNATTHGWAVDNRRPTNDNGLSQDTGYVEDGTYYNYLGIKGAVTSADLSKMAYEGEQAEKVTTEHGDTDFQIVELPAKQITKLTVYIWIEGQDVDCNNEIASTGVSVKLNFKAPNVAGDGTTTGGSTGNE